MNYPKTYDVVGIAHNADTYCPACARAGGFYDEGGAIFRDSESDTRQYCADCGGELENTVIGLDADDSEGR